MPYAGQTIMSRDYAREARRFWQNYELTKAIAKAAAESHFSVGAWHDNANGTRDCGVDQHDIPHNQIGTSKEFQLRTESFDPKVYGPIVAYSVERSWQLYKAMWIRDGKLDIRRWQAWVAYTSGWPTFPEAWVWSRVDPQTGQLTDQPHGPWKIAGRYLFTAIVGQMNNLVVNEKLWTPQKALAYAKKYADHFGIKDGSEPILSDGVVIWKFPPMPTSPPADGVGLYPVKNNGV